VYIPGVLSRTWKLPDDGWLPAQPSLIAPPEAVQLDPSIDDQVSVTLWPTCAPVGLAWSEGGPNGKKLTDTNDKAFKGGAPQLTPYE
jgi:hypothetical protein